MSKDCIVCGVHKSLSEFYTDKRKIDGRVSDCKSCRSKAVKAKYVPKSRIADPKEVILERKRATASAYWKTKKGKVMLTYNNMKRRVDGYVKPHLYLGLRILSREDFYDFSFASVEFNALYEDWVDSGFDNKISPSIDRIDRNKGYTLDNISWVTHSENSRRGAVSRHSQGATP